MVRSITFRSASNAPGILWAATPLPDGRVLLEPLAFMGRPTTDGSTRTITVSRRAAQDYFGAAISDRVACHAVDESGCSQLP